MLMRQALVGPWAGATVIPMAAHRDGGTATVLLDVPTGSEPKLLSA